MASSTRINMQNNLFLFLLANYLSLHVIFCSEGCPKLNLDGLNLNESNYINNYYIPYRYYSTDSSVISPFYIANGTSIFIRNQPKEHARQLQNYCDDDEEEEDNLISNYLDIKYTLDESGSKMNLIYETNAMFCDSENQISQLTIFDNVPHRSLSLYGCQEFTKNGEKIKFEGVLVLVTEDDDDLDEPSDRNYLQKSFDFIKNQIGLTIDQLSKYKPSTSTNDQKIVTCKDIQAKMTNCGEKKSSLKGE